MCGVLSVDVVLGSKAHFGEEEVRSASKFS